MLKSLSILFVLLMVQSATAGVILQASGVSTDMGELLPVVQVIDQSGLSAGYTSLVDDFDVYLGATPTHVSSSSSTIWASSSGVTSGNVDFSLGASFLVESFALWNRPETSLGLRDFNLLGDDDGDFSNAVALGSYTSLRPGTNDLLAEPEIFTFTPGSYAFVRMEVVNSYGGALVEFGEAAFEVQQTVVPEPSTLILFATTAACLFGFRRRQKRSGAV